jgi:hypothetical protein
VHIRSSSCTSPGLYHTRETLDLNPNLTPTRDYRVERGYQTRPGSASTSSQYESDRDSLVHRVHRVGNPDLTVHRVGNPDLTRCTPSWYESDRDSLRVSAMAECRFRVEG